MAAEERPYKPSLPWRVASALEFGVAGFISRCFLYGFSNTQVFGLDRFLAVLDGRKDEGARTRGLITGMQILIYYVPSTLRGGKLIGDSFESRERVSKAPFLSGLL